jgi:hypothetical protein
MVERYRSHLIFLRTNQDRNTELWSVSAHVQFNENPQTFRDIWLPKPTTRFRTRQAAARHMIKEAKKWVDDRLLQKNQKSPPKYPSMEEL